jgi:hypothetical protein
LLIMVSVFRVSAPSECSERGERGGEARDEARQSERERVRSGRETF